MAKSDMSPVHVWSNGRYSEYELFGREITSGPSFEIDRDYVAAPTRTVLHRLYEEGWISQGKTSDGKLILTDDERVVKVGVGLLGGPARFILDGERYDTPDELFAALSL